MQLFDICLVGERVEADAVSESEQVLVCDFGDGHGHELVNFEERYPHLQGRLVLEDLASIFEGLELPPGTKIVPHDFSKSQPIQAARFYYMRQIMHDWWDEECCIILRHLV